MVLKNLMCINGEVINIEIDNNPQETIDFKGEYYVSKGWVDMHTHCLDMYEYLGDRMDTIGIEQGVTTLVDAGTVSTQQIDLFRQQVQASKTSAYTFINVSNIGLSVSNELSNLNNLRIKDLMDTYNQNKDIIRGIKVRLSQMALGENGLEPLLIASYLGKKLSIPLMIHIGNPGLTIDEIIPHLKPGDVITHIFHGKEMNIFTTSEKSFENVRVIQEQGIILDLGHGSASFDKTILEKALEKGLKLDTIGSDIYRRNRKNGPVYSLAHVMSKVLNCGYTLQEVIDKVTVVPGQVLKLDDYQTNSLEQSDLTIFKVNSVNEVAEDSCGNKIEIYQKITPYAVVKDREYILVKEKDGNNR